MFSTVLKFIPQVRKHVILRAIFLSLSNLFSLQKQVSVMSMNLSAKLDELQRGDRHMETTVALCEIRTQLQELTKSVESCQSEVSEVSPSTPTIILFLWMSISNVQFNKQC